MKGTFLSKTALFALVVLGCFALLATSRAPMTGVSTVQAQGGCTTVTDPGGNTGPTPEGMMKSLDLGEVSAGQCFEVTAKGVSNTDMGEFLDEAEIECELGGDGYERWYTFKIPESAQKGICVLIEITFTARMADIDALLTATIDDPINFPQGVKIFRGTLNPPGAPEKIGPVLLLPGTYHLGVSNFVGDSPKTDITTKFTFATTGECQVLPARFENATTQAEGNIDAIFCGVTDLAVTTPVNDSAIANCITPPSYPATLKAIDILIFNIQGQPTAAGAPYRLLVYTDRTGAGMGPSGTPALNEQRNLGDAGILTRFRLNTPITITEGDFYVGMFFQGAHRGRSPLFYTSFPNYDITYSSRGGITAWQGPIRFLDDDMKPTIPAQAYVGAVLQLGAANVETVVGPTGKANLTPVGIEAAPLKLVR
jgi:hypothetical protein